MGCPTRERDRHTQANRRIDWQTGRQGGHICVCVCVCVLFKSNIHFKRCLALDTEEVHETFLSVTMTDLISIPIY